MASIGQVPPGSPALTAASTDLATGNGTYVGRHRKPEAWRFPSLARLFYIARHRAR